MVGGLGLAKFINPNTFSLKQIYYHRILRTHYYTVIETNDGIFTKEFFVKMNDGKDYIYSSGVGDYIKPVNTDIGKQEFLRFRQHIVFYDKKHSEAYTALNDKGELIKRTKYKPTTFEIMFNPAWHRKMREGDSISKTLTIKRNENLTILMYVLAAVVVLGALYIMFGAK